MMHIVMHVKSMKILPTHNVIYSIVQWYLKERHDFFHGPTVVNSMARFLGGSFPDYQ